MGVDPLEELEKFVVGWMAQAVIWCGTGGYMVRHRRLYGGVVLYILVSLQSSLDIGFWILDLGSWILDLGFWTLTGPRLDFRLTILHISSYELWSLVCCMTDVQWLWSISSNESEQLRLLKKLMNLYLQKSVARATEGRHALTYQEILSIVKEVAMDEGKSECMLKQGSVWENRKPLQMAPQDVNTGNNNNGGGGFPLDNERI